MYAPTRAAILSLILVFALSACGGGGGKKKPDPTVPPPPVDTDLTWDDALGFGYAVGNFSDEDEGEFRNSLFQVNTDGTWKFPADQDDEEYRTLAAKVMARTHYWLLERPSPEQRWSPPVGPSETELIDAELAEGFVQLKNMHIPPSPRH